MQSEYSAIFGQDIFDVAVKTYGDLNLTYKLISENPDIESVDSDLDELPNIVLVYDKGFAIATPATLQGSSQINTTATRTTKSLNGQSLYDICLMTYGSLDFIYKLLTENNVDGIDTGSTDQKAFTFRSDLITDEIVFNQVAKNGIVYSTLEGSLQLFSEEDEKTLFISEDGSNLFTPEV